MEAEEASRVSALLSCRSRADRGVEPPSFITLACKHNRADLLKFLLEDATPSPSDGAVVPRWRSVEQKDEGHGGTYYAIRSGNVELLRTLLGSVTSELSEQLVSKSYEELLLNNVLVSEEMHLYVQYTLLDLRFFSKGDRVLPVTSSANIQERIELLVENIAQINAYKEVDSHFLYTAKFITQNIHILKQQLKSTYNILPWEEIEFCLVSFVSAHIRPHDLNLFYLSVLTKERLLKELDKFASDLQELKEHIGSTDVQNFQKSMKLGREDIVSSISSRYPDLYTDYKDVRDVSSLHIMKTYLEAALLADPATRHGQLTIKRALQVTGEHLKNTLDSPKLSPAVSDLLLLSVPQETKTVLQHLSNSLSHPHLESADSILYSNIQNDLKKITSVIVDIAYFNKVDKIKCILTKLINSDSVEEFLKIVNIFQNVHNVEDVQETDTVTRDHRICLRFIRDIEDEIPHEKKLLAEIKDVLNKTKSQHCLTSSDYLMLKDIHHRSSNVQNQSSNTVGNIMRDMKYLAERALKHFSSQKTPSEFKRYKLELDSLLSKYQRSISTRKDPRIAIIVELAKDIIARSSIVQVFTSDKGNISSIDDYSRQLLLEKFNESDKVDKQLTLKLTELENTMGVEGISCRLYEFILLLYKDKTTNRFAIEALVLDIMSLLDSAQHVPNNMLYLDGDIPVLNGKCLRNHLARGNALVDILPTDAWSTVLLNAAKLTESKDRLLRCKIGNILTHNIKQLRHRYERGLSILDKQKEMWTSLLDGNFENFTSGIAGGADICSRKEDLSSTLHFAARGPNIEIIKFLTKQEMISTEVRDLNGQTALHIAAAFGRDAAVKFLVTEMGNAIDHVDGTGKTPLHLASQNGHKKTVVTLLSLGAKTTVKDITGISPLHYAVVKNDIDLVKILSEKDATVDENTDSEGCTSLHIAAEYGHIEIVQYLLLNEAAVNAKGNQGAFPLHLAAGNGHLEVVKTLLEKGAYVNFRDLEGHSPLYNAVISSHEEIVKILLEKGAFVQGGVIHDSSPFHSAVFKGNAIIVELLLQHNANVNARRKDHTPLHIAAACGHTNLINLLLQNGALADSMHFNNGTALHCAARHGHTAVVETLIQRGIDIHIRDKSNLTPLHVAARAGHLQVVDILLAAGANVHSECYQFVTALHLSSAHGHEAISETLIKKGAKVSCKDINGNTPLHAAATKTCNEKTIKMLLKHGANVKEKGWIKRTALHLASLAGDSLAVEALLQAKADVDAKDSDGDTALHLAASGNHKAAVEVLLQYGAYVNSLDDIGGSPLCWAVRNNNKDLVKILIDKGADVNVGEGILLLFAIKAGHRLVVEALLKSKDVDISIKDENGLNLLYSAAVSGDALIASALIERGLNVADCTQNPSPLYIAIRDGHTKFIEVMLENKANVNPTNPIFSPLHLAVCMNKPDILERLLHWGANCNIRDLQNRTPLQLAVANVQIKNTAILLQQEGARINEEGNDNRTLLYIAAIGGNLEITKLLVDRGADINAIVSLGDKPIHMAAREGHHSILAFFLELGMSIDDLGSNGRTLMHYAACGGQLAVAQYLIDKQVDVNSTDLNGFKPIHCSAELGHTEMVKLLLHSGAEYDATDKLGRTPSALTKNRDITEVLRSIELLFRAVQKNDILLVDTLVKDLAKYLNVQSSDKATLLHIASWSGFQKVCDVLLKSKANPNAIGKGGNAALHYASKYSHLGIVKVLLENGAIHNLKSDDTKTPLEFATQKDIKSLLQIIAICFWKVQTSDVTVIEDITNIRDVEVVKAVMRARDTDGNTLVVAAMKYGFPDIEELKQVSQAFPDILSKVESLFKCERFIDALDILKQLLNERIEILGEDNPGTLDVQYKIALALHGQCKYFEAMPIFEDIYKKRVETFGPHHPDSLKTGSSLAVSLHKLGRNEEAWDILQEIMPRQQEVLGGCEGHEPLMQTESLPGLVLLALKKYEEALHFHTKLYERNKIILGAQHLRTYEQLNNIALVLHAQGKHREAFAMFQTVYEARKTSLGQNHSDTLRTRRNMASVLMSLQRLDEGLQLLQEIEAIQKNVLGVYHEDIFQTQRLMMDLYLSQNNLHDALKLHREGLDARNVIFGPNHPYYTRLDEILHDVEKQSVTKLNLDVGYIPPCDFNLLNATSEGDRDEVRRLIENGWDVSTADGEGRTVLHFAATVEVMELLLDSGANATAVSQEGNTPLHFATSLACVQMVRLLLQNVKKTDPNAYHEFINAQTVLEGSTALHIAAEKGAADIVSCLLAHGACYNSRDNCDNTPLQCSCNPPVTRLLRLAEEVFEMAKRGDTVLPQGDERHLAAVVKSRDTEDRTPSQLAAVNGHTATARLLAGLLETLD